jgi:UDP-N-acetyl-D-glucosamine dehydrogenase
MPDWVATRVGGVLNDRGLAVKGADILVLGVSYKADVGDVRESPSLKVMQALHRKGANVRFHDFYVEEVPLNGGTARGEPDLDEAVADADCVVLLTPHADYDLERIADRAQVVFDARNAFGSARRPNIVTL